MDDSIFTQQFQSVINRTMYQMLGGLLKTLQSGQVSTTGAAKTDGLSGLAASASASTQLDSNQSFAGLIQQAADRYGVNAQLVNAVIKAESNYNPDAVSYAGATGLMQLMPATAQSLGVTDPTDPAQNIDGGVRLLRQLLNRYDNNIQLALAAYNAGPGAVDRYNGIPPYQETQTYVSRVMGYYQSSRTWEG